jgi:preprotein translocase subunit SecY
VIILTLTAGTVMLMWFGELITEYGIGNGISLMIFAGIIGRGPQTIYSTITSHTGGGGIADYIPFIVFGVIALAITAFIIWVHQAVRKIPIQSAQRVQGGSQTMAARASFLPLRVNTAGVIPIIFAISIMFFPTIIANYLSQAPQNTWYYNVATWVQANFVPDGPNLWSDAFYNVLYFLFIFAFTYFYTFVSWQPDEVATSLRRQSTFIPGIRPGRPTEEYLTRIMNRITFFSGIYLGLITVVLPLGTSSISGIPHQQMYLGGTAILIVVGVALDTMKQLETQLVMRQYRGFIN